MGRSLIACLSFGIHSLVLWGVLLIYTEVVPLVLEQTAEQKLNLPQIGEDFVYPLAAILVKWSSLLVVAHILIDGPVAVGVCYLPRSYQSLTWIWFSSYLLVGCFMLFMACVAVGIPLVPPF